MSDPKEQQKAEEEQVEQDLTVPEEQGEDVRAGDGISLTYSEIEWKYGQQK